jgi:hypothetical protein
MSAPLADIRVVDLSTVIAGPNCVRYLADFGADHARRSATHGELRWPGRALDADGEEIRRSRWGP